MPANSFTFGGFSPPFTSNPQWSLATHTPPGVALPAQKSGHCCGRKS